MIFLLICLIISLLISNVFLWISKRKRSRELTYIYAKVNDILEQETTESIRVFTDDQEIKELLIVLNRLLAKKNKTITIYTQLEQSIRRLHTNMSHDLKTPLSVIFGISETLTVDQQITPEQRNRLINKIQEKAQQMLELMNKFFELAKLESGDFDMPLTLTDVSEICKNSILFFYEPITEKGLDVQIDIPEKPIYIHGNATALNRVLHNLLSNAIRYGADGQTIGLSIRFDDLHVWVDVWDQGKGIQEREQKLIFERLYTLEDSRNLMYQGSGLGLTITKRLVEKSNGEITLMSEPFKRTIFTLQWERIHSNLVDERLS